MTYAYFLDNVTDNTPNETPQDVVLIGELSNDQRTKWRESGRILGMSCALRGQSAATGYDLWSFIQEAKAIPNSIKDGKSAQAVAEKILDSVLTYNYPGEFPTSQEVSTSKGNGYTIWMQDFEFTPNKANANDVYAGITAVLWAGRQLLGSQAKIVPVPASSIFKNLGNPDIDEILNQPEYLKALQLENLEKNNPEQGSGGQWNFLSVLKHNKLIDGFLGQQYSTNNIDALPGSISKDTRHFDPSTELPYAVLSNASQLSQTDIQGPPWPSYFDGDLPFEAGVYFADKASNFNPDNYLNPQQQTISQSALAQIFYTSDQFRALSTETRDLRQHPELGGISSTRWEAYENFTAEQPELESHLKTQPARNKIIQLVGADTTAKSATPPLQHGIRTVSKSRATLNKSGVLTGHDGADSLGGSRHDDLLIGHSGDDRLNGRRGNDWLFGGEGADQFIIPTPKRGDNYSHVTTLPDFDGSSGDKIRIRGAKNFINSAQFQGEKGEIRTESFNPGHTDSGLNLLIDDNGDAEADRIVALPGTDLFRSNWLI